jgi:endo-1,4-beta-xylanase
MKKIVFLAVLAMVGMISCQKDQKQSLTLKDAFNDHFLIGAALNYDQASGNDTASLKVLKSEFNTITPENLMKWERIHPQPDQYNFKPGDQYVELGMNHDMFVVGHTLVWHNQTPDWVFENEQGELASRDTMLKRMKNHINKVAGHFKGKVDGWDVVNEAVLDNGPMRKSKWYKTIGRDFVRHAFQYAHEAAPDAELYYNDYSLWKPKKREGTVKLVRSLLDAGVRVDAIGMQGHWGLNHPSLDQIEASIQAFSDLGVKVMITELDIDVLPRPGGHTGAEISENYELRKELDPYRNGLPDSVQTALAERYEEIFRLFLEHSDKISRVTFWGVNDEQSWKNNFPVRGRTNYPLLFDRNNQPKAAYDSVIQLAKEKN